MAVASTSRRQLLVGALAAWVGGLGATREPSGGPLLYWAPGPGTATGYSTFKRHLLAGTAAGTDFDLSGDRTVFPMAGGVVAYVGEDAVSGRVVIVDHGFYQSRYAHLAETKVAVGQAVRRDQPLGVGGATGLGAALGPHLHVDVHADALLVDYLGGPVPTHPLVWLDPMSFAARPVIDDAGNPTLPYRGTEDLDTAHHRAYRGAAARLAVLIAHLPSGVVPPDGPASIGFPEGAPGRERTFREGLRRLHAARLAGIVPVGSTSDATANTIRSFLQVRPRLTAPLGASRVLPA